MGRILQATDYPNLHSLNLYNVDDEAAERILTGKLSIFDCF
jgi:hypothetical protein